jgi:hypothetical protein
VVLAYGLCGGATAGLRAGSIPLVVPRAHDCIMNRTENDGDSGLPWVPWSRVEDHRAIQLALTLSHELSSGSEIAPKSLRRRFVLAELEARLVSVTGTVADIARELVVRCRELTLRANELEHEIGRLVRGLVPSLLELPGRAPHPRLQAPRHDE